MRELFSLDLKNYDPQGKVFSRPSVRGIIIKDGKVLLVHSQKYGYYKFPGGGMEDGEDHRAALAREVKEETGYCILPESIEEYGYVPRRQRDSYDENGVFAQDNFYYFCNVSDQREETRLDDYEREEGFAAVWMDAFEAAQHNRYFKYAKGGSKDAENQKSADPDEIMISREARVLDMVDLEIRRRKRMVRERQFIRELGDLDYAGMLDFVEREIGGIQTEAADGAKFDVAYDRFEHVKRVLGWAKRLYDASENQAELRYEDLMIAAIFHDVGRGMADQERIPHAQAGVPITRAYLLEHGFEPERVEYVCTLVAGHSDKYRMKEEGLDSNLLLLMEADLLDDMGAQGIVMDCMITESRNPRATFTDCLDHVSRYTLRQQQTNPMVTEEGRRVWEEKTRLTERFVDALTRDLVL